MLEEKTMACRLSYAIEFVADTGHAVKFYRDVVGLSLKFESPEWAEFQTGETTFALHPASRENPAGKIELGLMVKDLQQSYEELKGKGVRFLMPPTRQDYGGMLARFEDSEGTPWSLGGE
jgi:lactoylglutathione lyase